MNFILHVQKVSKMNTIQGNQHSHEIYYSKDLFNGPKHTHQLRVHSFKRKMKIWQKGENQSHLEFHSIFNQDGLTNFPKKSAVSKGKKKGKTNSSP